MMKNGEVESMKIWRELLGYVKLLVIVVAIILVINNVVLINAKIPSPSMEKTLMVKDRLFGFRVAYGINLNLFGHEISDLENMILGVGKYKNKDVYLLECKEIADRLSHMIKEILDTSRLDFLAESENTEEFNLAEILNKICEPYQLISQSKGIDFQVTVQNTCLINTSKKHMEKLLSNVLSNAVSYTDLGHSVSVVLQKNKIMVKNECTPIPENIIPHLFEPFYRPDFARNRKDGGNGLGLYIVDMIAKSLNLTYTFKQMNTIQGMCFTLYF